MDNHKLILLAKETYRNNFYLFVQDAFKQMYGFELTSVWFLSYLCGELSDAVLRVAARKRRRKHYLINILPRSLKSFVVNVCLPAWTWLFHPEVSFMNISATMDLGIIVLQGQQAVDGLDMVQADA